MKRWAVGLEYLGSDYSGWQAQSHARSIQAEVEKVLSAVADQPVTVAASGRTDAGVHAFSQVVHFDSDKPRSAHAWLLGSNTRLPPGIALRWVQPVSDEFHARYSATARHYRYVIHNGRARSGLLAGRAAWVIPALDAGAMHHAAQVLVGEHDFSAFRGSECQSKTPMRNLHTISVQRSGEFVVLDVSANAFLHHMVRNIAGVLIAVGQGRQPAAWVDDVLKSRNRQQAGETAEACGLYLVGPDYPARFELPPRPRPWFPVMDLP